MERALRITGYEVENLEDLREVCPSAFTPDHNRSRVYSKVMTTEILKNLEKLGWTMTYAKQQGNSQYSRHIIRLTNPELGYMPLQNDRVRPQLILDNSHNGGSSAQLHMGLLRMVCQSEMVIAIPNLYTNVKFRHMGLDFEELKEILAKMAEQYKIVAAHISEMQDIVLSQEQRLEFAMKGAAYRDPRRYINEDGTINEKALKDAINPEDLLQSHRGGDNNMTLWGTFQTVREWLIKGGFSQKSEKGRRSTSKAINNAVRQIELNKTLWILAEEFLNKPVELDVFDKLAEAANNDTGIRSYTNSKGVTKQLMVIEVLENGKTKVIDKNSNIYLVPTDKLS